MQILSKRLLDEKSNFLPAREAMEKYRHEKIEPVLDKYRLYDHSDFKDFNRRKGLVIHSSEFIHRLQNLSPAIFVQHQLNFSDDWGIYIDTCGKQFYLSGFPKGWLTEFSYALVDDRDLPIEERRGWRTVLLRLMASGILTWDQVISEFGDSEGLNSERWLRYSTPYRNGDGEQLIQGNLGNAAEIW